MQEVVHQQLSFQRILKKKIIEVRKSLPEELDLESHLIELIMWRLQLRKYIKPWL